MILVGVGQGAARGPLTAAGVAGAPHEDAGARPVCDDEDAVGEIAAGG